MREKLEAIVGQLRRSSAALDRINALRDQPWIVATETERHMMLIFQGNGKLLVTVNGDVHYGRYEVIEGAESVLLNLDGKPRLYKHGFIDDALMVLKLQGYGFEPLVLVNEAKVPDLDVEGYLERVYLGPAREAARVSGQALDPSSKLLGIINGAELRAWKQAGSNRYINVTLNDEVKDNGFLIYSDQSRALLIVDTEIKQVYKGIKEDIYSGDDIWIYRPITFKNPREQYVYQNGSPAPDGTYKTGWFTSVKVKGGVVV